MAILSPRGAASFPRELDQEFTRQSILFDPSLGVKLTGETILTSSNKFSSSPGVQILGGSKATKSSLEAVALYVEPLKRPLFGCRGLSMADGATVGDGDAHLVAINPSHVATRRNSDIEHEIAHIILGHEPSLMFMTPNSGIAIRTRNEEQEEEATCLAGLLPLDALLLIRRLNLSMMMRVRGMQSAPQCCDSALT